MSRSAIWVSRRNVVQDFSRRYVVFIDGVSVGTVAPYRTGRYAIAPGWHRVWARLPNTGDTVTGDVVVHVKLGEVRRVRTTSRLKRMLPVASLVRTLGDWGLQILGRQGFRLPVEFSPAVMLRIAPTSDEDRDPPPTVWTPRVDADGAIKTDDPEKRALAERIRNATFKLQPQGYSVEEVDGLLDALATALEDGRPVDPTNLTGTGVRKALRGYEVRAVDQFFEDVRASLNEMWPLMDLRPTRRSRT